MDGRKQGLLPEYLPHPSCGMVQCPVVEPLEEEGIEDCCDPERWSEKPTRLTQRVDEKDTNENSNRTRESNRIVGTDADKT